MSTRFGPVMQHGYIVEDVNEAAAQWVERVGVGPFYVLDHIAMDQYYYRGVRTDVELRIGFGYWGGMQIELVQPLGASETFYSDALRTGAGKLNHCAVLVDDLDAVLAERGLQDRVIHYGHMPTGLKFVYLKEYLPGGLHLELIQATADLGRAFGGMQALAQGWDGRDPIRSMARLGDDLALLAQAGNNSPG